MGKLSSHIGGTLANWGGGEDGDIPEKDVEIPRGQFSPEQKEEIAAAHFRREFGAVTVTLIDKEKQSVIVQNAEENWVNLAKGLARRHVVSSENMIRHYKKALVGKKWSAAKLLIEQRGSIAAARTPVASPLNVAAIVAAARARYNKFFGFAQNIFIGDMRQNSRIQQARDPYHPDMVGSISRLDDHVRRIGRSWALDEQTFVVDPAKEGV